MLGVTTRKQEASSFKAVKTYFKQVLVNKDLDLAAKKEIAHSFEKILEPFAQKKRLLYRILFFIQFFKNRQINDARKFIQKFNACAQDPSNPDLKRIFNNSSVPVGSKTPNEETLKTLADKRILQNSAAKAYEKLFCASAGSFVLWQDPKNPDTYIFFQKTNNKIDKAEFNDLNTPPGAVSIGAAKNLQAEINRLTSFDEHFKILQDQGIIYRDYASAVKALEDSQPYAVFFEEDAGNKTVHFLQKIPGVPLAKNQAISIKLQENLFEVIERHTSQKEQSQILQKLGKSVETFSAAKEEGQKLQDPGDYFIYKTTIATEVHYLNTHGKLCEERIYFGDNLFGSIEKYTGAARKVREILHTHLTDDATTAKQKLVAQEIGSFLFYKKDPSDSFDLIMKISPTTFATDTFYKKSYLEDMIQKLITPQGFWKYLELVGYAFEDKTQAQAANEKTFTLWKNKDQNILFAPRIKGIPLEGIQPIEIANNKPLQVALKELHDPANTTCNSPLVASLKAMGAWVKDETEARTELLKHPLGSYVLWENADQWFILQKLENNAPILNAAQQISPQSNLWLRISELSSEAAQLEWLKSHLSPNEKDPEASSNGNFTLSFTPPLISGREGHYIFAQKQIYGHFNFVTKAIDLTRVWEQIDSLTSSSAQFARLKKHSDVVVSNQEEAEKKLANSLAGKMYIWQLAEGQVGMLVKTNKGNKLSSISLDQNLCKEILKAGNEAVVS
ncbi:MAG: hypothetical protein CK425_11065 [Parachlamydia sp.]|nr:MAG: hypothetical protein CK425_11065 [Parachlamydia sp.]